LLRGRTLGTRKPARLAAAGLAAALIALPAGAEAKDGCALIVVLLAKRDARLKDVGVVVSGKGLVDAAVRGKPSVLRGAAHCSLESPKTGFDLDCNWDYAKGEDAAAKRDLAALAARLNACLPAPLKTVEPVTYTEARIKELAAEFGPSFEEYLRSNRDLGHYEASYPVDEAEDVSLRIDLSLDRDDRDGTLRLSAGFSRY
jgi:hypothetical protein